MKNKKKWDSRAYAFVAFLIVFLIQICLNLFIVCMRSLPDEMGAVALAAKWVGYDWNYVLTHPSMYYGSGTSILLYPFFVIIKNPLVLYQCLLGVGAFLHAVPAYIACRIIQKYYIITNKIFNIISIGVLCGFFTPTRATNIDNEPMLIVLCWLCVYLIVVLMHSETKKKKIAMSILLSGILSISYFSHTRAILYGVVLIIVVIIYKVFTKKWLVNIPSFLGIYIVGMLFSSKLIQHIKATLFVSNTLEVVKNTPEEILNSAVGNTQTLFSKVGIHSFIDLFFSNIWVISVFSCGIILYCIWYIVFKVWKSIRKSKKTGKRFNISDKSFVFPALFCILGIFISIIGLCIIWLPNAVAVHSQNANLSRGHFYLRYYGNYFAPLMLFFIINVRKIIEINTDRRNLKSFLYTSGIVAIMAVYSVISFLGMATIRYSHNLDWFYYFAPLSGMLNSWPNTIQTLSYFACATLISLIVLFMLIYMIKYKKRKSALILGVGILIWQYAYGVLKFDKPYSASENYYMSVDTFYDVYHNNKEVFDGIDEIYYFNDIYGPQYIVQFMIPNKKVITDLELIDVEEENLVLTNSVESSIIAELDVEQYVCFQLDENEYIYTNIEKVINLLKNLGYLVVE